MIIQHYPAKYIDKSGKVQASHTFQTETNIKSRKEATHYKISLGYDICSTCKTVVIITGETTFEPELKKPRGRPGRHGINKINR